MKRLLIALMLSQTLIANDLRLNQFKGYVARFLDAAKAHSPIALLQGNLAGFSVERLVIETGPTRDLHVLGDCQLGDGFIPPRVTLSFLFWDQLQEDSKEIILFHELGHCLLGRQHEPEWIEQAGRMIPKSLMFPSVISDQDYLQNRNYYLDELFSIQTGK